MFYWNEAELFFYRAFMCCFDCYFVKFLCLVNLISKVYLCTISVTPTPIYPLLLSPWFSTVSVILCERLTLSMCVCMYMCVYFLYIYLYFFTVGLVSCSKRFSVQGFSHVSIIAVGVVKHKHNLLRAIFLVSVS